MLENTLAHLDGGDAALADGRQAEFRECSPELRLLMPGWNGAGVPRHVQESLIRFPHAASSADETFLYWSQESVGLKTLLSVTHVAIFPAAPDRPTVIASNGIYSSHYLDASRH